MTLAWITGVRGMLGRAIAEQLDLLDVKWVGTDVELDIADASAVQAFAREHRPTIIMNCAAHTAVDAAEQEEAVAYRVNGLGPEVLAGIASEHGALLVHVSTDYIFDGNLERGQAYSEYDTPCPGNAYGRTKLAGELGIRRVFERLNLVEGNDAGAGWLIFRTSWLFGAGRSSFVDTMWRLMLERETLSVVDDQIGRPTYVRDLAIAMTTASGLAARPRLASGIWHFANTGSVSWFGFANAIRSQMLEAGIPVTVKQLLPIPTDQYPRPARRPKNSVLSTDLIERRAGIVPRNWSGALSEYLDNRWRQASKIDER